MKRDLFLVQAIIFALAICLGIALSCGGSGDDDDDSTAEDCIACSGTEECVDAMGEGHGCVSGCCIALDDDDDDTADDDDGATCEYEEEIKFAFETCHIPFFNEDGVKLNLSAALADCNECVAVECEIFYFDDCGSLEDCIDDFECFSLDG